MERYVRKAALDRYPEVAGGLSDPDCTHVILTEDDYRELHRRIAVAERDLDEARRRCEREIQNAQSGAQRDIHSAREAAKKEIEALTRELEEARAEIQYQTDANKGLWQRLKEKSNADRELTPKKEHSGYCVIYSAEREHRYKKGRQTWAWTMLWETVLQSPYTIDFTEQQARRQIWEDLFKVTDNAWGIASLGIRAHYKNAYETMLADPEWDTFYRVHNVLLEKYQRLRANYKTMYWEVVIVHTKPIGVVPPDMRARKK